jgi:hypothetical protein
MDVANCAVRRSNTRNDIMIAFASETLDIVPLTLTYAASFVRSGIIRCIIDV